MQGVVKSLSSIIFLVFLFVSANGQEKFVIEKKYDFKKQSNTMTVDTTLSIHRNLLPQIYSHDQLSLFCKIEEKVAMKSNVNMRFRLGSLDYVNYLEQKPNYNFISQK